jgi:hypothetical protein
MACTADMTWAQWGASLRTALVTCTVTNGGTSAVNVTQIDPGCVISSTTSRAVAVAVGVPMLNDTSVPAGGTKAFVWRITFHSPTVGTGSTNAAEVSGLQFTPTATLTLSDGSVIASTNSGADIVVTTSSITAAT